MATKFYKCRHCDNVIHKVVDFGVLVVFGRQIYRLLPPMNERIIEVAGTSLSETGVK